MIEKLDYYDLLGVVVPGTLLVGATAILFPQVVPVLQAAAFPDGFAVVALIVLAFFIGQLVQATGSIIEPALHWTWGGRPSDLVFRSGLPNYLPKHSAVRICGQLRAALGPDADERSLFLFAMQRAEACEVGRAGRFNCLYAYQRGMVVLVAICIVLVGLSARWGAVVAWSDGGVLTTLLVLALLLVLVWNRAKQRGMYYVREVLLCAERTLNDRPMTEKGASDGAQRRP